MGIRQIIGIAFFALGAVLLVYGVITILRGPGLTDPSGFGVSHAVGAMLPTLVCLIIGACLIKKPKVN